MNEESVAAIRSIAIRCSDIDARDIAKHVCLENVDSLMRVAREVEECESCLSGSGMLNLIVSLVAFSRQLSQAEADVLMDRMGSCAQALDHE